MGTCDVLEINTKGLCLLCFGSCSGLPSSKLSSKGFQQMLHYLSINTKSMFACSPHFLQSMELTQVLEVKISLCSDCSSVGETFSKLYKDYELIRFQFDNCVKSFQQSIKKGDESPERVRKFKTRMQPRTSADLLNASIAVNLRTETYIKCCQKLDSEFSQAGQNANEVASTCTTPPVLEATKRLKRKCVDIPPPPQDKPIEESSEDDIVEVISCEFCSSEFSSEVSLRNHVEAKHAEQIMLKCLSKGTSLDDCKTALASVVAQHKDENGYQCRHCSYKTSQKDMFHSHVVRLHQKQFAKQLSQHLEQRKGSSSSASGASKASSSVKKYPKAVPVKLQKKRPAPKLVCDRCDFVGSSPALLEAHKVKTHTTDLTLSLMLPGTPQEKCQAGVRGVLSRLRDECPVCNTKSADLQLPLGQHLVMSHFEAFVEEVKTWIGQSAHTPPPEDEDSDEIEMIVPLQFGDDEAMEMEVKVETSDELRLFERIASHIT